MWRTLQLFLLSCIFACLVNCNSSTEAYFVEEELVQSPIGAGIEALNDWSRSSIFIDLFKQARTFNSPVCPHCEETAVATDNNGWPLEDFATYVFTAAGDIDISGTYRLSFEGQASVESMFGPATIEDFSYNEESNVSSANIIIPPNCTQLVLKFTNTEFSSTVAGVKNISLLRPGYSLTDAQNQIFTSQFLSHIQRFGILRSMDFTKTNFSNNEIWSERAKITDARYSTEKGVPWEIVITLANMTQKDIWINLPHKANEEYLQNLAMLFAQNLYSKLNVYTEYSNEVWNSIFSQSQWNYDAASDEVGTGFSNLNYDDSVDTSLWARRRIAFKARELGIAFKNAFATYGRPHRVRPVYAAQFFYTDTFYDGLNFLESQYGSVSDLFHCIGVAPYFNSHSTESIIDASKEQVLESLRASLNTLPPLFLEYKNLSQNYNLRVCAYEAGPDTYGANNISVKRDAMHDPEMQNITYDYIKMWFDSGFSSFLWFHAGAATWNSPYGTWSLTEDMNSQDSPKILGIDAFLNDL